MFITFEGPDASGKTTIIIKLVEYLTLRFPNLKYLTTREPGGKDLVEAEKIRQIILDKKSVLSPVAEAMLYSTSRRIHLERVIWPALKENKLVLCDRYVDSFFAYQGYARGLGIDYVKTMTNLIIDNTMPEITIFLNITPDDSKLRMNQLRLVEEHDRLDNETDLFRQKVYEGYWKLINEDPERFIVVDANKSISDVLDELVDKLFSNKRFSQWIKESGENVSQ
ncbi:dTMP kinase [Mycoplasma sp. ES3157-GEN-MYC]|uniref:Thymidylate kinase n=1 Tax=Mycoplasma miroungigenitalium TaxID=754515 RepID=A0A6M4JBN6_9MOLU|nr:dTMP kinase [Mycoplasma miroungigenitalium]MBU4690333.1 dTMP kinase [Mycoplasma miroungigenitalium]MBU4691600.1 dTMP kinase [Mycoplasma miroungigenitalium]QJR43426.1 dTMP kinase [Mycoplasma miroungigenitalium]